LSLKLDGQELAPEIATRLREVMQPYLGGECPLEVSYKLNGYGGDLRLSDQWKIEPSDELIHGLKQLLGSKSVSLRF